MDRYYFYDDRTKVIYYSKEMTQNTGLVYIGTSNNPNPKMAAAVFLQQGKVVTGFRIKELPV